MLIGLLGAEPQQINSSEQIMTWADIRPPPTPLPLQTHILILLRWIGCGEGERESEWRSMCDYDMCVGGIQRGTEEG